MPHLFLSLGCRLGSVLRGISSSTKAHREGCTFGVTPACQCPHVIHLQLWGSGPQSLGTSISKFTRWDTTATSGRCHIQPGSCTSGWLYALLHQLRAYFTISCNSYQKSFLEGVAQAWYSEVYVVAGPKWTSAGEVLFGFVHL